MSPQVYGQQPLRPEGHGDPVRDRYEMDLIEGFLQRGKPILDICRGCQLLHAAFCGTLTQDLPSLRAEAERPEGAAIYDELAHGVVFEPASRLASLYPSRSVRVVNSIHHQAVDRHGGDLHVEARGDGDGVIEAIRANGSPTAFAVQWHPEFQRGRPDRLDPDPIMSDLLALAREQVAA